MQECRTGDEGRGLPAVYVGPGRADVWREPFAARACRPQACSQVGQHLLRQLARAVAGQGVKKVRAPWHECRVDAFAQGVQHPGLGQGGGDDECERARHAGLLVQFGALGPI